MTIELNFGQVRLADGTVSDVAKEIALIATAQPAPATDVDVELEALAEAALMADMEFKDAETKQKSAKDAFKKALADRGLLKQDTKAVGVVRTIIKKTRRFDPNLAKQLLSAEEIAKYSDISSALVKANVAPNVYEMFQADQGFSLELKVAD